MQGAGARTSPHGVQQRVQRLHAVLVRAQRGQQRPGLAGLGPPLLAGVEVDAPGGAQQALQVVLQLCTPRHTHHTP